MFHTYVNYILLPAHLAPRSRPPLSRRLELHRVPPRLEPEPLVEGHDVLVPLGHPEHDRGAAHLLELGDHGPAQRLPELLAAVFLLHEDRLDLALFPGLGGNHVSDLRADGSSAQEEEEECNNSTVGGD